MGLPLVAAHADPAETVYDALALDLPGWLSGTAEIVRAAPSAGAVPFAAYTPGTAALPLDFTQVPPERFTPTGGLDVRLVLSIAKPMVAQDANGNSVRVQLLADGAPVSGADRSLSLGQAVMAPGTATLAAVIPLGNVAFLQHEKLTLRVTPQMPALADGTLSLVVGPEGSRANLLGARLADWTDLGLVEPPEARVFLLANGTPPTAGAPVVTVSVTQNQTQLLTPLVSAPEVWVVLRGDHNVAEGRAYHEQPLPADRNAAAEVFRVGQTRVRVHPGLGIALKLRVAPGQIVDVACESCPSPFKATLPPLAPTPASPEAYDPANVLIPPPRATAGIPVSGDAPAEKKAPTLAFPLSLALCVAVAYAQRRR
jgi:hypothetical protein